MIRRVVAVLLVALVALAACGDDEPSAGAPVTTSTTSDSSAAAAGTTGTDVYADDASWLCRPEVDDACEDDIDATVVRADGTTSPDPFRPDADAPIDCFYVYPTVSLDPGANSDMEAGAEEKNVARRQAARFESACRMYAPLYRQATLTSLRSSLAGTGGGFFAAYSLAYGDVLAAWRHYLATDNKGRGVVLIGHSQGAAHLQQLLEQEIDPDPAPRKLLVSAMLMGTSVHESELPHIPPCRSNTQTGCIITYSTFRDTAPPPTDSYFARPEGTEAAICTNPASLAGGSGLLDGYYASAGWGVDVSTPWVKIPGLLSATCKDVDGFNHLSVTANADPGPRVDDVRGTALPPQWGMHTFDVSEALGNLVEIARAEAGAYSSG